MIPRLKNAFNSEQISNCYESCESQAVTIALPAHKVLLASIRPAKARTEHYLARLTTIGRRLVGMLASRRHSSSPKTCYAFRRKRPHSARCKAIVAGGGGVHC